MYDADTVWDKPMITIKVFNPFLIQESLKEGKGKITINQNMDMNLAIP